MNEQKTSSYRWVILLMTFLPCFWMSVCQFQATPYAADLMQRLSLAEQQYATIATAPMLVGVFISFLSGTLGDKFGVKKTVAGHHHDRSRRPGFRPQLWHVAPGHDPDGGRRNGAKLQ